MNALVELQKWYRSHCDGDWEHGEGISIGTLDNPGWTIEISLRGTDLEGRGFREHAYGVGENAQTSREEWLTCKVEKNIFKAFGGPFKLEEMIGVFLDWASRNGEPGAAGNSRPGAQLTDL
jgi:Immunity protein 53